MLIFQLQTLLEINKECIDERIDEQDKTITN